jgi:N-acylneuraminate cytidylyltransferase
MKLAVIPARGGSKRIPKKNIRDFCGRPVIEYSIEAAIQTKLFDRILVSTDDDEIRRIALNAGVEVPFLRPSNLSDDYSGTNDVVKHAIEWFRDKGTPVEYACCLYATAPFIRADDVCAGFSMLQKSGKSFAFSVTTFDFPVQRSVRLTPDGAIAAMQPDFINARSQDLEPAFHDAAQFYWGKAEAFVLNMDMYAETAAGVVLPRHRVQDIDTNEDWIRAELMFRALSLSDKN